MNVKKDFPIFDRKINGHKITYLDNAATSQKPHQVIESLVNFYSMHNANVHRGIYELSEEATTMYETSRTKVAQFINANNHNEIIFTSGSTHALNLVAYGWLLPNLHAGDIVISTRVEHHSNLVPWQQAVISKGARLELLDFDEEGEISLEQLEKVFAQNKGKVKAVAISHASNVMGTIFPVKRISKIAHYHNAIVIVDGAQAIPHLKVDVKSLGCDFYAFSGHKMLGPMGIGVLWGKSNLLEEMNPIFFGGGMISEVSQEKSTWTAVPERFEAGTQNVAGAIGLASAVDYLEELGMDNIRAHEKEITAYALEKLLEIKDLQILGTKNPEKRGGLISFTVTGIHPHDLSAVLSNYGICTRSGQHCTMPLHKSLNISSSTRASFYIYNDKSDVDKLVEGINSAIKVLK